MGPRVPFVPLPIGYLAFFCPFRSLFIEFGIFNIPVIKPAKQNKSNPFVPENLEWNGPFRLSFQPIEPENVVSEKRRPAPKFLSLWLLQATFTIYIYI